MIAVRAWLTGLWRVVSAPIAVVAVYLLTIVVTVPFGAAMHTQLAVPVEPVVTDPTAGPTPDFDWLDETASKSGGLVSTLAPVVIGVAAPLSNLSSLVDGHPPPLSILMISAIYFVVWIVAWGGIVQGLSGPRVGLRACITASRRSWLSIARLGLMGLGVYLLLFATLHPLLLDVAHPALASGRSERASFVVRVALAGIFVLAMWIVSTVLDYARIDLVLNQHRGARIAVKSAITMLRDHPWLVIMLSTVNAVALASLLAVYGAIEFVPGGSAPRVGRIILLGQMFILARIVLRLWNTGAQVSLYQRTSGQPSPTR